MTLKSKGFISNEFDNISTFTITQDSDHLRLLKRKGRVEKCRGP